MERRQLEYLVAIDRYGGFGRAAANLNVTQSALSQAISQLERELGFEVFHRRIRPVRLTSAGETILEPARQTLGGFATVASTAASIAGLSAGYLELATLPTAAQWPATPLVAAFREAHPAVRVHIRGPVEPRTSELAKMIKRGACEVGLTEQGSSTKDLVEIPLGDHDYVAVLPPHSTHNDHSPLTYEQVLRLGIIVGPWWESSRPYLAIREHCPDLIDDAALLRIDHRETYIALILSGAGAAILPRFVGEIAAAAGATVAEIVPPITRNIALVHRETSLTPAAHAFVELATELSRRGIPDS